MSIRIIKGSSGPTTTEEVLQLIVASPQGITAKEICRALNRPVSMVQICLKALKSSRQIYAKADGAYKPRGVRSAPLRGHKRLNQETLRVENQATTPCPSRARSAPHENDRQIKYYPRFHPN